jgi:hypothetical protein
MTANIDQPGSQEYVAEAINYIKGQKQNSGEGKGKQKWNLASIPLFQVVLVALLSKIATLEDLGIINRPELQGIVDSFKDSLLVQLRSLLKKPKKAGLKLLSTIDTLSILGVDGVKLAEYIDDAKSFIALLPETEHEVAARLENFIAVHSRDPDGELLDMEVIGDTSTIYGRRGMFEKASALTAGKSEQEKLVLLKSTFGVNLDGLSQLDKALAAKHIISACKGMSGLTLLLPN